MESGSVTTPFGRRRMTIGMFASQIQAQNIEPETSVDKWKLYRALCEARKRLGITDRSLTILNALLSFYPKPELSAEHGLIVFPSNAQLSLRANGMAEATIRRHLSLLVEAGLLTRKDSANGKRYARRDAKGVLDEAFGFSLAPLLARATEIEMLASQVICERLHLQKLRERLTICRRDVGKLIEAAVEEGAPGDWDMVHADFRALVAAFPRSPTTEQAADALAFMELLRDKIVKRLEMLANVEDTSANPLQNERHIQNSHSESLTEIEPRFEKDPGENSHEDPVRHNAPIKAFPLNMVLNACPEIAMYGPGGAISNWREMTVAAFIVGKTLGVSPAAYREACEIMGPENASVALACILEKGGQINSAGGYLRDLTRRAEKGEFSLGPMLMALLRANNAGMRRAS
jgi:replication initiation protein RepC